MRLPVNCALPLAALVLLSACGGGGAQPQNDPAPIGVNGPSADYPIVVGAPFTIDGTTYTPVDKLNFDEVGYAVAGIEGGGGVTIAHKTLPLPSYAEVTALDSGKTILVRVERRGPMVSDRLVELSPGAAAQLGLGGTARAPIRIRRVNPPEMERSVLRRGQAAPARMDTPPSLLTVLKRKLDPALVPMPVPVADPTPSEPAPSPKALPSPQSTPTPRATPSSVPTPRATPGPRPTPSPRPVPSASPAPTAGGAFLVQVGAFANAANANAVVRKVGGSLRSSGTMSRVIMGPFSSRAQADAALARARAAGYKDARIQRAD